MNPVTKLWEFYHLASATDPDARPPTHDPDTGHITVTVDSAIVFVLLPSGTFWMGAQSTDPNGPNYDKEAESDGSPVHEVTLAPFFLARHELTKGQWQRLTDGDEPSQYEIGRRYDGNPDAVGYAHPVEQIDWSTSDRVLRAHGLVLPTEAQWEYGCRGGESTPWWSGPTASSLEGCANVFDLCGERVYPAWGRQEGNFDDGLATLGPVGSYRANGFGLFDVHGNVWEWCLDEYDSYSGMRNRRGGSCQVPAWFARSAQRGGNAPTFRGGIVGARAAKRITKQP